MSSFKVDCGHTTEGRSVRFINRKGGKAFKIFQKYWGKKTGPEILEKGGGYKDEYLTIDENAADFFEICPGCLSEWQCYRDKEEE